jgi:hypothetical protein
MRDSGGRAKADSSLAFPVIVLLLTLLLDLAIAVWNWVSA